jgi:stage V sporulation protein G
MEITSINIKVTKNEAPVCAYCSVIIDDAICIRKIRIIEKNEKFYVFMPSMKCKDGKYSDVCHPINQTARNKLVTAILNTYLAQLKAEIV